jgi:DNA-binding PadR family transcriptional regulator
MQGLKGAGASAGNRRLRVPRSLCAKPAGKGKVETRILGRVEGLLLLSIQNLGEERAYGAEIQRHLIALTGRKITLGQIYTTLDRLEAKSLIRSRKTNPEPFRGGRTKRVFHLEELGVRALEEAAALYTMDSSPTNNGEAIHGISKQVTRCV